jgi:hypothetical protein
MNFISAKNVALLVAAGLLAGTGSAVAAGTATPASTATAKAHTPNPDVVAYKAAITTYRAGHKAADDAMRAEATTAKSTRDAAITAATTPEAKKAAHDAFKSAMTSAKATHDAAIAALGAKPTPPVKPAK